MRSLPESCSQGKGKPKLSGRPLHPILHGQPHSGPSSEVWLFFSFSLCFFNVLYQYAVVMCSLFVFLFAHDHLSRPKRAVHCGDSAPCSQCYKLGCLWFRVGTLLHAHRRPTATFRSTAAIPPYCTSSSSCGCGTLMTVT